MEITICELDEHNIKEAVKIARKSFGIFESFFIRKPKQGFVAVIGDKVVGGVFYSTKHSSAKKFGVISFLFTAPRYEGHGIAGKLLDACIAALWADGCDGLVSYVQDDNVGSWINFEKRGFVKTTLLKSAGAFGTVTALKIQILYLETYISCVGADFYIALPDQEKTKKYARNDISFIQILFFILLNMLFLTLVIVHAYNPSMAVLSIASLFTGMSVVGFIGTWFTGRKWRFRLTQGGFVLVPLLGLFAFYPMIGNWYPLKYENTPKFRRDLAFNSILIWLFLLCVVISTRFTDSLILAGMGQLAVVLLIFRCIPIIPFSSYGSGRVYEWNKIVFALFAIASLLFVFVL